MALQMRRYGLAVNTKFMAIFVAVFALLAQPFVALNVPKAFATGEAINISTVAELRTAIENQQDGQTWTIHAGEYGVAKFDGISVQGQSGWYLPLTANNLTINGVGNPTLYGTGFTANGNWSTQNFVSVFGDHVTINGLTLMPKVEPNKTIEVLGSDFTLRNTVITPNTLTAQSEYDTIADAQDRQDEKQWGGSLYFSHGGNHIVDNVTINNAGVSFRYAPAGTHIAFTNTRIVNATNVDWINGYRFSSGFNTAGNTTTGLPSVEYRASSTLDNLPSIASGLKDGDTISLDSDLTLTQQFTLTKSVTLNGNGHALKPVFAKTDTSNNSALGIQANNVTVNNLVVDGASGTNLHGINAWQASGVALNGVTSKDNDYTGIGVNSSSVTVNNVTTSGNGWHGINVDKPGAVLTVNGTSHHSDTLPIYVDNRTVGQVVDTNHQYGSKDDVLRAGDRVYSLKPGIPTLLTPTNHAVINTNDFWFDWSDVAGAAGYEAQFSQSSSTDANGSLNSGVWEGDYQHTQPTASTLHSVGANGTWYWQVRTVDANGIKSGWSPVWAMTIDMQAPTAPVLSAKTAGGASLTSGGYSNAYSIVANWTAPTGDPVKYLYKYWNTIPGNPYDAAHPYVVETTSTSQPGVFNQGDGTHYMQIFAVDAAGNVSAGSNVFEVKYDATAPTLSVSTPTLNELFGGLETHALQKKTITVVGSASDASGLGAYCVKLDGGSCVSGGYFYQPASGTLPAVSIDTSTLSTGNHTITLRVTDRAGNATEVSRVVEVDNAKPVISTNIADNQVLSGSTALTLTVTDAHPQISNIRVLDSAGNVVQILGVNQGAYDANATNPLAFTLDTTKLANGTYKIQFSARDGLGNSAATLFRTVTVANIAPVVLGTETDTAPPNSGQSQTGQGTGSSTQPTVSSAGRGAGTTQSTTSTGDVTTTDETSEAAASTQVLSSQTTGEDEASHPVEQTGTVADATTESASGFAWYWWLVVVAAVIAALWAIFAALRRRQAE